MGLRRIKDKVFRRFEKVEKIDYSAEKNRILSANRKYLTNYSFDSEPLVSIIVLNRNGVEYLKILFDDFESLTSKIKCKKCYSKASAKPELLDYTAVSRIHSVTLCPMRCLKARLKVL